MRAKNLKTITVAKDKLKRLERYEEEIFAKETKNWKNDAIGYDITH